MFNTKLKAEALHPGDTIGIVTPASPMQVEKLEKGIDYLKKSGFKVEVGEHVFDSYGYLAGKDRDRALDLMHMFKNPNIKAIIASRGGYGTPRLLDKLSYDLIKENPKILVGYSDLTALQLAIWKHTGLITFSGPMVAVEMGIGVDPFTQEMFWPMLHGNNINGFFNQSGQHALQVLRPGRATGVLLGGCLSLINCLFGTKNQPDFSGAILVLEDIEEEPYRLDRYFSQMQAVGIFEQVNGIILGQFVDCDQKDDKPALTLDEIFADYFGSLKIPVVSNFLYGHVPRKFTIPFGVEVAIDTAVPEVRLLESPVANTISA